MRVLLDNDVFFAALVQGHPHHAVSRRWLDQIKPTGWGIASETYLAAVRLLMNPRVSVPLTGAARPGYTELRRFEP